MPTLASCGCSFSDYTGDSIKNTYGAVAAKSLNLDYLHLAQGCSSKDRVYKSIVQAVRDEKLVSGDLVCIQYPDPLRQEVMSPFNHYQDENDQWPDYIYSAIKGMIRDSDFGRYNYYNYKPLLHDYHNNSCNIPTELFEAAKNQSEALEVLGSVNERFVLHNWQTQSIMLEGFLEHHNIDLMYVFHRCTGLWHDHYKSLKLTSNIKYWEDGFHEHAIWADLMQSVGIENYDSNEYLLGWDTIKGMEPVEFDSSHYSQLGHTFIGEKLAEHILDKR